MCGVACHPHFLPTAIIAYFLTPVQLSRGQEVEDSTPDYCVCVWRRTLMLDGVFVSVIVFM